MNKCEDIEKDFDNYMYSVKEQFSALSIVKSGITL